MDVEQFWKIIDSSRRGLDPEQVEGSMEQQAEELRELLMKLPPEQIVDFRNHFVEQMNAAYRWDLWGAAYIIAGGCSDDGFMDFRSWLISMGRAAFEAALADPESLIDIADAPGVEDVFFEALSYVPAQAYEELTGHGLPDYKGQAPSAPAGERWSEDESDLQRRFPRLWARYHQ
jgi:hypothetical protein